MADSSATTTTTPPIVRYFFYKKNGFTNDTKEHLVSLADETASDALAKGRIKTVRAILIRYDLLHLNLLRLYVHLLIRSCVQFWCSSYHKRFSRPLRAGQIWKPCHIQYQGRRFGSFRRAYHITRLHVRPESIRLDPCHAPSSQARLIHQGQRRGCLARRKQS